MIINIYNLKNQDNEIIRKKFLFLYIFMFYIYYMEGIFPRFLVDL